MKALYGQFVKPGDLVFNIGANIGTKTRIFLDLGARVVAVEPQPQMCRMLQETFGTEITLFEAVAGPKDGKGELWLCTDNQLATCTKGWAESLQDRWPMAKWHKKITVPMISLDTLIIHCGKPTFCKIDVEGYENMVLRGLSQRLHALSFEYTVPFIEPALECIDLVRRLGMKYFNYIVQENYRWELDNWADAREMTDILWRLPIETFYGDVFVR